MYVKSFLDSKTAHRTPFFYLVGCPYLYIKKEPTNYDYTSQVYWLCVCASGSRITAICKFFASINVSCLHFGQKRGKFFISISNRILTQVLFLYIGQCTHCTSISRTSLNILPNLQFKNIFFSIK